MGYRSDVGLCLNAESKARLGTALNVLEGKTAKTVREFIGGAELREDKESAATAYLWRDIKWYSDYPEVSFMENFLAAEEDDDFLFIRIGESDDDIDYRGTYWGNPLGMCLVRSIAFD
jgi:hypothetical protein